jgi:hypothetical protein
MGLPGPLAIFSINRLGRQFVETQKFLIEDFNEKLDVASTTEAVVNGRFVDLTCNNNGDSFLTWLNGPDIEVYKYPAGKTAPTMRITGDVTFEKISESNPYGPSIRFECSKTNPNLLYYTSIYRNEDHETELIVGKMDFSNGTKKSTTQVFTHDDLKAMEKSFTPISKKLKDVDLGFTKGLDINDFVVGDNVEIIPLECHETFSSTNGGWVKGYSVIYNVFDENLKLKFQPIFPETYKDGGMKASQSNHLDKDKLYVLGHMHKGGYDHLGLYGVLSLNNGQWDKVETISEKPIKQEMYVNNAVWLKDYFFVAYSKTYGTFTRKTDIDLQQNQY